MDSRVMTDVFDKSTDAAAMNHFYVSMTMWTCESMCKWLCMRVLMQAEEEYLHSQAVIRHRNTGVAVPAHVHGGVGTVVRLLVQ